MDIKLKLCFFLLLLFASSFAATPLKIAVFSDIHYLSPALMDGGAKIQNYEKNTAKDVTEVPAILKKTLAELQTDVPDVLLIPGDLTKDGAKRSHTDLKLQLDKLANLGTRIFVIPGNHDVLVPHPMKYEGDKAEQVPNVSPDEFAQIYSDFGYKQAFSRDTASLSYVVALDDYTWLIGIDSNRYREYRTGTISAGRVLPETEKWILNLLAEARQKKITVLGMMHHGLVEHFDKQDTFFPGYLVYDWKRLEVEFANNGMKAVFTGHFHANDITGFTSHEGNHIYDIETGALCSFPFPYRKIIWNGEDLDIHTFHIRSIPDNPNLAVDDSIAKLNFATAAAKRRLIAQSVPDTMASVMANLIGTYYLLHVQGDEKEEDLEPALKKVANLLGDAFSEEAIGEHLDFPPADNDVTLKLK